MSDSEDDYMSSKILDDCKNIRPSLLINGEKRKHKVFKEKQDAMAKRQKTLFEMEMENRNKGLSTAISSKNKGFKLLEKMGFKAGETLGKNKNGLKEPVEIILKHDNSGIGNHPRDGSKDKPLGKICQARVYENFENEFKLANKERNDLYFLRKDFNKAQRLCEELDFRQNISEPLHDYFWTNGTIKTRRNLAKTDDMTTNSEDIYEEEFEQYITQDNLFHLIDYIRKKHIYCMYCLIIGTDEDNLKENCPGAYRHDHCDQIE